MGNEETLIVLIQGISQFRADDNIQPTMTKYKYYLLNIPLRTGEGNDIGYEEISDHHTQASEGGPWYKSGR